MGACISSKQERLDSTKSLNDEHSKNVIVGGVCSATPRMIPLAMDALPDQVRSSIETLPADSFKNKYAPVNVIGTIAKSSEVAASLLDHYVRFRMLMSLTNREKELIILRVAVHYRSNYVWKHHVVIGSEFGITTTECESIQQVPPATIADTLSDRESALIALTDDLVISRTITNSTWQRCSSFFEESEIIDIILMLSHYVFFSLVNNSLCVEIEPALNDIPGLLLFPPPKCRKEVAHVENGGNSI